jgi:hypothetical protein
LFSLKTVFVPPAVRQVFALDLAAGEAEFLSRPGRVSGLEIPGTILEFRFR